MKDADSSLGAWGDESIRTSGLARPSYLLGAVIADPDACQRYREQLVALHRRGPKLPIDRLRGKHALPAGLRIDHGLPSAEPMLWVADQVLGALGESMSGRNHCWFDTVRHVTTVTEIDV